MLIKKELKKRESSLGLKREKMFCKRQEKGPWWQKRYALQAEGKSDSC